jgi:hypothetical protein
VDAGARGFYASLMQSPRTALFSGTFPPGHPILVSGVASFAPAFRIVALHEHPEMVFVSTYSIYRRSLNG